MDPDAPVMPLGQLVFLSQFLVAGALFAGYVRNCPLQLTSPNVPAVNGLPGTSTLAGEKYRHLFNRVQRHDPS